MAIGLTPQLLPAIISINLSHGANVWLKKVIIKRLASIENFGSMNILCSDKTGTLTEGIMHLHSFVGADGNENQKVFLYAYLNSSYETGYNNPIDTAIRAHSSLDISAYRKLDEVPYDFIRKRLSILVSSKDGNLVISKGTLPSLFSICSQPETAGGIVDVASVQGKVQAQFEDFNRRDFVYWESLTGHMAPVIPSLKRMKKVLLSWDSSFLMIRPNRESPTRLIN